MSNSKIPPPRQIKPHLTRHILDLVHPMGLHLSQSERRMIAELPGVHMLACDVDSGHIEITYDLNEIHLDSIEERFMELGYVRKGDIFHRLRNKLAHVAENNELAHF